jgi:hypothetical protein
VPVTIGSETVKSRLGAEYFGDRAISFCISSIWSFVKCMRGCTSGEPVPVLSDPVEGDAYEPSVDPEVPEVKTGAGVGVAGIRVVTERPRGVWVSVGTRVAWPVAFIVLSAHAPAVKSPRQRTSTTMKK